MPRKPPEEREIRVTTIMVDNQTWNDCPDCGKTWQTIPAIPGLIHRTTRCTICRAKSRKND